MRFANNSLIGVLLKLPFRDVFRETPLFLPGSFRDCRVFDFSTTFSLFLLKMDKTSMILIEAVMKKSEKDRKSFQNVFRETLLFLPGTFRDCGFLNDQKHLTFLIKSHSK